MNNQSYEITVDTRKSISHSNIEFAQNNLNISELIFNITEDEKAFPLNDTDKIIVYFEKPDKTVVFQDKEVELLDKAKGKIKVLLTSQTLIKAGDVKGQISIERIEDGTKKRVNTYYFSFKVRSSIASNDSIESTNEFPMFDKALEVGEKFKDVDINGIIAAGAKADAALPKAGGTMTGTINIANTKGVTFQSPGKGFTLATSTSPESPDRLYMFDSVNNKTVIDYNAKDGGLFTLLGKTNLLKTTGDTMTGNLVMSNGLAEINFKDDKSEVAIQKTSSGAIAVWDRVNQTIVWQYFPTTKEFRVPTETNLIKKAGDSFTGTTSVNNDVFFAFKDASGTNSRAFKLYPDGKFSLRDLANGKDIFDVTNGKFNVNIDTNLVTKAKDGRATLTLTADAELIGSNGVIADRRGNTVTLRAQVRRKAGSTGNVLFTMPSDMKPLLMATQNIIANDGTVGLLTVSSSGDVTLTSPGSTNVAGKDFSFTIAYVVD